MARARREVALKPQPSTLSTPSVGVSRRTTAAHSGRKASRCGNPAKVGPGARVAANRGWGKIKSPIYRSCSASLPFLARGDSR